MILENGVSLFFWLNKVVCLSPYNFWLSTVYWKKSCETVNTASPCISMAVKNTINLLFPLFLCLWSSVTFVQTIVIRLCLLSSIHWCFIPRLALILLIHFLGQLLLTLRSMLQRLFVMVWSKESSGCMEIDCVRLSWLTALFSSRFVHL